MTINYLQEGIEAKGHSPAYKTHKYFARRPHNVFRYLIEAYTSEGDIILDPFCGGGVTLVEGVSSNRKIVATDVNPLATFISESETTFVSSDIYDNLTSEILEKFNHLVSEHYVTTCRICKNKAQAKWYELTYKVICQNCKKVTPLSNNNKSRNGFYKCTHCSTEFSAVDQVKKGYEIVKVVYECKCTPERQTVDPVSIDIDQLNYFEESFDKLIDEYNLWYPANTIPEFWDRQQEDCLYRKSIHKFSDLFTRRALFFNAYLLKLIHSYKGKINEESYKLLIFLFSSVIRYTNNMTYSASNWMDGRPIAWDKHAYWIPNQFVEVNPAEYFEKRKKAMLASLKSQNTTTEKLKQVNSFDDLKNDFGTHSIWNISSSKLPIPNDSIDAIITDPPYGSNVQYGELSHYWLVWLQKDLPIKDKLFNLNEEILVNRKKTTKNYKNYEKYFSDLYAVYSECYRVLKPDKVMVFTFNNKELKTWYSMIKAVILAGFDLEPEGVIYQSPIKNYKNTAHNRFEGTLHGDFIYTFVKNIKTKNDKSNVSFNKNKVIANLKKLLSLRGVSLNTSQSVTNEYLELIPKLIPYLVDLARAKVEVDALPPELVSLWVKE